MAKQECPPMARGRKQGKRRASFESSINEEPINLVDKELDVLIEVIKPSRAAVAYERME